MKPKVLLVDDDNSTLDIFTKTLEDANFSVLTAKNGQEGIEKAKNEMPNVILLDEMLPDMTGNAVLENLKKEERTKDIPVCIVSNFSQPELIQEALTQGASEYILRYQIESRDLVEKVRNLIK